MWECPKAFRPYCLVLYRVVLDKILTFCSDSQGLNTPYNYILTDIIPKYYIPYTITYPTTQSHTLYNHIPYTITYPTQSHTLHNHIPYYTITYPTQSHTLLHNHIPYTITYPIQSHTLYNHIPYTITYPI